MIDAHDLKLFNCLPINSVYARELRDRKRHLEIVK